MRWYINHLFPNGVPAFVVGSTIGFNFDQSVDNVLNSDIKPNQESSLLHVFRIV
jgi:hypothetical protein